MVQLFVGLGNPGKKYALTRHNLGFMVLEKWAASQHWEFKKKMLFQAWVARGNVENQTIHLLMPSTYMNESGLAVSHYMDYAKLVPQDLLVVVDDTALPFGELRLRNKGSAGGHNGLKSIEAVLETQDYARLRMGIGHQGEQNLADYVLSNFTNEEQKVLPEFVKRGVEILKQLVYQDIASVMKTGNAKSQGM